MADLATTFAAYGRKRVSVDGLTVEMRSASDLREMAQMEQSLKTDPWAGITYRAVSIGPAVSRLPRTCTESR